MKLVIATHNKGKLGEYRRLLADWDFELVSLDDIGIEHDVDETGDTFEANAILKAEQYGEMTGLLTIADDSGLSIDALDGRPGVYSARYGGPGLTETDRRHLVLRELEGVPMERRTAQFVCVIALHDPAKKVTHMVKGTCKGHITREDHDAGFGFGYDAVFQPLGYSQTFGELSHDIKHSLSHRGEATAKLPEIIKLVV
jgi:XTP/dITP diphosphohydrolase